MDDMIISGGVNVHQQEIEMAILRMAKSPGGRSVHKRLLNRCTIVVI